MTDGVRVNVKPLMAKLAALKKGAQARPYLAAMQQALVAWVARNFRAEGLDSRWRPMSANTAASRRGGGGRLLQDTGHLRASFAPGHQGSASRIDEAAMNVTVGTNVQYAKWHEFGTKPYVIRAKGGGALAFMTAAGPRFARSVNHPGLPARKMLPVPATAKRVVLATLRAAMARMLSMARGTGMAAE